MKLEMGEDCHHRLTQEMHFGKIKTASHKLKALRAVKDIHLTLVYEKCSHLPYFIATYGQ